MHQATRDTQSGRCGATTGHLVPVSDAHPKTSKNRASCVIATRDSDWCTMLASIIWPAIVLTNGRTAVSYIASRVTELTDCFLPSSFSHHR